jgi:hypothetical protein
MPKESPEYHKFICLHCENPLRLGHCLVVSTNGRYECFCDWICVYLFHPEWVD